MTSKRFTTVLSDMAMSFEPNFDVGVVIGVRRTCDNDSGWESIACESYSRGCESLSTLVLKERLELRPENDTFRALVSAGGGVNGSLEVVGEYLECSPETRLLVL